MGAGCSWLDFLFIYQILMEKCALSNGCFFHPRNRFYTLNVKYSILIFWSLYLSSIVLIPRLHTSASSWSPRYPYAQLPFVPVVPLLRNDGLPKLKILGAYPAGRSDTRGNFLRPLLPPFLSGAGMYPWYIHFLLASLGLISPDSTYSCAGTARSAGSGGGGK